MALIRNPISADLTREAIVLDLSDIQRQAAELKAQAEREAEQILIAARTERQRLLQRAAAEGHEQGMKDGREQGLVEGTREGRERALADHAESIEALVRQWSESFGAFEGARDTMLAEARTDVLRLAIAIAERITRRAVEHDGEVVKRSLEAVLSLVLKSSRLVIAIHPDDRAEVERALPALLSRLSDSPSAEITEDQALSRGSCIVRTDRGLIDGTIEVQLDRIVTELLPRGESARDLAPGRRLTAKGESPTEPAREHALSGD